MFYLKKLLLARQKKSNHYQLGVNCNNCYLSSYYSKVLTVPFFMITKICQIPYRWAARASHVYCWTALNMLRKFLCLEKYCKSRNVTENLGYSDDKNNSKRSKSKNRRREKSSQRRKVSKKDISMPLNDLRHTAHIGSRFVEKIFLKPQAVGWDSGVPYSFKMSPESN